jgi:hypothetical protein
MRANAYTEIPGFRATSFDEPEFLEPSAHVCICSKLPWDIPDPLLRKFAKNIPYNELESVASTYSR